MKYRSKSIVVPIFAAILLSQQLFAQDVEVRRLEAERFAKEAVFLKSQNRREAALEKIEAAAALDPENTTIRRRQIEILTDRSYRLLMPDVHHGRHAESYPRIDKKTMQQSLQWGILARDLHEKYFENELLISNDFILLREAWNVLAETQRPELKPEVEAFNRRVLTFWRDHIYRPALGRLKEGDRNAFLSDYLNCISFPFQFDFQAPDEMSVLYEEIVDDLLPLFDQAPNQRQINSFVGFFAGTGGLMDFAASCRDVRGQYQNKNIETIVVRICDKLEGNPFPLFQTYGWFVRNKVLLDNDSRIEAYRANRDYFEKTLRHLESQAEHIDRNVYTIFYNELDFVCLRCYNPADPATADTIREGDWSQKNNLPLASLSSRILETACKRRELSPSTTWRLIIDLGSDLNVKPGSRRDCQREYAQKHLDRYSRLISAQIQIAENFDPDVAARLKRAVEEAKIPGMERDTAIAWTHEIPIFDGSDRGFRYRRPIIRGETLYVFSIVRMPAAAPKTPRVRKMRLDKVDLKTMERVEGRHLLVYKDDSPGITFPMSHEETAWVDDVNAYFGNYSQGIFVFPLDDSEPWSLGTEDGLPDGFVQGLASIGGTLYAGLGKPHQSSWLIAVDLKTRNWEVLASSSGKEGKAPFFNLSPPPRFLFFCEDAKRNRLLMFVAPSQGGYPTYQGLWEIDGTTGQFRHLRRINNHDPVGQLHPDGNRLLLMDSWNTNIVKLDRLEETEEPELLCCMGPDSSNRVDGDRKIHPTIKSTNIYFGNICNDWLWGIMDEKTGSQWRWSRVRLDGTGDVERLNPPKGIADTDWLPREVCTPTPDGNGLVVGDQKHLIILRFK